MRYYWYFNAGKFAVIDETGESISASVPVTVKYQQRAVDTIKSMEELSMPSVYDVKDDLATAPASSYCIAVKPIPITSVSGVVLATIPVGERLYVADNRTLCIPADYVNNAGGYESIIGQYPNFSQRLDVRGALVLETAMWEYQDDGYDSDVQLTAAYYAASMLADMVPDGGQLVKSLFDRYRYRFKDLQIRHNAARYVGITIKPNHF